MKVTLPRRVRKAVEPADASPQLRIATTSELKRSDSDRASVIRRTDSGSSSADLADTAQPGTETPLSRWADRTLQLHGGADHHAVLLVDISPKSACHELLLNMGEALSQRCDARILLVDANLAGKFLTEACHQREQPGLAEAINVSQSIQKLVVPTRHRRVDLLAAGRGMVGAGREVSGRVRGLLQDLTRYRFVLTIAPFDDSALLRALARYSDTTMLFIRQGTTEIRASQSALHELSAAGGRVLGAVVS